MIITVTPNPSLDRALDLDRLCVGGVNRAVAAHVHAGGKGVNVSRALAAQGLATRAVLPAGGAEGDRLVALLADQHVATRPVPVAGATRSNLTLTEASGVTTKVNAPGHALAASEVDALLAAVEAELAGGSGIPGPGDAAPGPGHTAPAPGATAPPRAVVAAGSLPAGTPDAFYVRLAELGARHDVPVVVDASGAPFAAAVAHGGLALVKPNDEELAELTGRELVTVGDVLGAAAEVLAAGTGAVLVSLGAHGALLAVPGRSWWAGGPALVPLSTVGAGDSTLAGFLAAGGDPADRLRRAVAWGRAAVLLPGSAVPRPSDVRPSEVAVVADPDPSLALKEL